MNNWQIVDAEISIEPIGTTDTSMRREITASILSIIAERDDLVTFESALAVNDRVSSKEKEILTNPVCILWVGGK
jgi:hypothetical protein